MKYGVEAEAVGRIRKRLPFARRLLVEGCRGSGCVLVQEGMPRVIFEGCDSTAALLAFVVIGREEGIATAAAPCKGLVVDVDVDAAAFASAVDVAVAVDI